MMKVYGKFVAVNPLVIKKDESAKVKGLDMSSVFTKDLIKTEVVMASDEFSVGTILYFKSDVAGLSQNKAILSVEGGLKFVLLPIDWIVAYDQAEYTHRCMQIPLDQHTQMIQQGPSGTGK